MTKFPAERWRAMFYAHFQGSTMDRAGFIKLLAARVYPLLRAQGFRGSGTTLRRINGPVIHIFNVQGSSSATEFYLNLGAHLEFLPPEGGRDLPPASMLEYHCAFRARIDPPAGPSFAFAYGGTHQEAVETIGDVVSEWSTQGGPFFDRFSKYPESFTALIAGAKLGSLHARDCLHYARIAAELGRTDRARAFAHAGLESATPQATILRADLHEVLRKIDISAPRDGA